MKKNSTKLKVAIVTQFPINMEAPHGGVEAVSVTLVKSLAKFKDLELHVITVNNNISLVQVTSSESVTIHRLSRLKGSTLVNSCRNGRRQICDYLLKLSPDIVHAHDTYGIMVKGLRLPRVFTIHGFIYGDTMVSRKKWPWLRSWLWRIIETTSWADQPNIVSISPYVRERIKDIVNGKIHDIDNPISDVFFNIKKKEKIGSIFSAALISPRKNTLNLIKAFDRLVKNGYHSELRLAGRIVNEHYGNVIKNYLKCHGLVNNIVLLGELNTGQIVEELSKASIFALVSIEENSPLGIEEAMAAGVPVVASNRCGIPYMVRDGESGYLVDSNDPNDIFRHLEKLLEDKNLRHSFGECARAIAVDRFQPDKVARRTRKLYIEAVRTQ